MLDKLAGIEERYQELNRLLTVVGDDYQRAAELNKERIDLEPIVGKAQEYRQALSGLEEARALLDVEDADLRQLAEAEVAELDPVIARLEGEIKSMLLPKDRRDHRKIKQL